MVGLPSVDDVLGAPSGQLPSVDDVLGPAPAPSWTSTADKNIQSFTQHVLNGFSAGARQAFGEEPISTPQTVLSPETVKSLKDAGIFNDYEKGQKSFLRSLAEGTTRAVAAGAELLGRTSAAAAGALLGGAAAAGEETGLAAPGTLTGEEGLVGAATDPGLLMLAGPLGEAEAANAQRLRNLKTTVSKARAAGAIGEGDAEFYGAAKPTPEALQQRAEAAKEVGSVPSPELPAPKTPHELARRIEPEAFQQYDELAVKKDQLRQTIEKLLSEQTSIEDTRGKGVFYHGTSRPFELTDYPESGVKNIYGSGFYTTEAQNIATGYTNKGKGGQPTLYEVKKTGKENLIDMDAPIAEDIKQVLLQQDKSHEDFGSALGEALDEKPKTLREVYDKMREVSYSMGLSASDVQDEFDELAYNLQKLGYTGLQHIGGKVTGNKAHIVQIHWEPKTQGISIKQIPIPKNNEPEVSKAYNDLLEADAKQQELLPILRAAYDKVGGILPEDQLARAFANQSARENEELTQISAETEGQKAAEVKSGNGRLPENAFENKKNITEPGPLVAEHEQELKAIGVPEVVPPIRAFHGTTAVFSQFKTGEGIGPHFGTTAQANEFATEEGGNVHPVTLDIKHPLRTKDGFWENPNGLALKLKDQGVFTDKDLEAVLAFKDDDKKAFAYIREAVKKKGYDGFVYANEHEGQGGDSYIPLDPEKQVQSVFSKPNGRYTGLRPVEGTGETRVRGLAAGVEEKALENKLTEGFGDLPEYKTLNMADQAQKAIAFVGQDFEAAKDVAMGRKQPPPGLAVASVFKAVEDAATNKGDVKLISDLGQRSKVLAQITTMAQNIRVLAERDPISPVGAIQELTRARTEAYGAGLDTARAETIKDIKDTMGKAASPVSKWEQFIQSIACKE